MADRCDSYCKNCIYCVVWNRWMMMCSYFLETDKRRPCPPGTGCTVKEKRKRKRRVNHE